MENLTSGPDGAHASTLRVTVDVAFITTPGAPLEQILEPENLGHSLTLRFGSRKGDRRPHGIKVGRLSGSNSQRGYISRRIRT